jgi:hypothetical protein
MGRKIEKENNKKNSIEKPNSELSINKIINNLSKNKLREYIVLSEILRKPKAFKRRWW